MSTGKRFVPTSDQKVQVHDILDRLKELQRDPAVWKAFLDEQRRLFIASELHAKKWGDPCEGTVVMLKTADMPTQDRPPHRYRSRTRSAMSTPEASPADTTEATAEGRPAGPALEQGRELLQPEGKPSARRRR